MAKGKKVSKALRDRLLGQKKGMGSGAIINNKNFTKGRFRLIPVGDDQVPGVEYITLYCDGIGKKGSTSPRAFGLACPICDYRDQVQRQGDKEEKEHLRNSITIQTEYWMGVFDREDMGTSDNPKIRVLRGKRTVYEAIIGYMVDEDDGEDITDPTAGRDVRIRKEGSGTDTKWTVKFLDREPIMDDDDENEAYAAAALGFDPASSFYEVDWEIISAMYEHITGEEVPDHYLEQKPSKTGKKSAPAASADDEGDEGEPGEDETEAEPEAEPDGEEEATEPAEGETAVVVDETIVEFDDGEGEMIKGVVVKVYTDADDDAVYDVQTGDDPENDTWTVYPGDVTVVEEAEPEPVEPTKKPAKKTSKKKTSKKKPTGKKTGKATGSIKDRLAKANK